MNANYRRVPTRFGPETRFELKPVPAAPFRAVQETKFERLKNELLDERLEELANSTFNSYVRTAANEAAALAWVTPYPLLVFPTLFEEKASSALHFAEKQDEVFERSRELLTV